MDGPHIIREGDQVIIRSNNVLKVFQMRKFRQIRVEKSKFTLDGAIGECYGTTFEVKGGKLVKIEKKVENSEDIVTEKESERDNRNLTDTSDNQKLKKEDIHALRKEGATGKEIVGHLIENSATFKEKTEFSQEKYISKKKKKHETLFTILKPNTRLLAQMYFKRGPTKICNLRHDSIAQILTYANVRAGCKLMVFESVTGLLVGAIMERLAHHGTVIQFYTGSAPARQAMEAYDFPAEVKKTLWSFPLNQVNTLSRQNCPCAPKEIKNATQKESDVLSSEKYCVRKGSISTDCKDVNINKKSQESSLTTENEEIRIDKDQAAETDTEKVDNIEKESSKEANGNEGTNTDDITDICDTTQDDDNTEDNENSDNGESGGEEMDVDASASDGNKRKSDWDEVKERRRNYRVAENTKSQALLESGTLDGLIIATKFHPTPVVMSLIDFVAPSRPIVIFSQYKEPLLDCYVKLRDRGGVFSLKLTETWLRHYQVLPNRTHPEINMSGSGGYLLTGTTVLLDS